MDEVRLPFLREKYFSDEGKQIAQISWKKVKGENILFLTLSLRSEVRVHLGILSTLNSPRRGPLTRS